MRREVWSVLPSDVARMILLATVQVLVARGESLRPRVSLRVVCKAFRDEFEFIVGVYSPNRERQVHAILGLARSTLVYEPRLAMEWWMWLYTHVYLQCTDNKRRSPVRRFYDLVLELSDEYSADLIGREARIYRVIVNHIFSYVDRYHVTEHGWTPLREVLLGRQFATSGGV